ncbi:OmpA family protein [Legionella sp. W05-934-2]|jgi:intracellular multiplication protein IcmN|uniref:OmpA family protein n=1 Tax=Legionella sp. W05-934-2 TaxID=1198649 RepID=UPI003461941B
MAKCWQGLCHLTIVVVCISLVACASRQPTRNPLGNDLPKKVYGASDRKIIDLQRALNKRGIKVISIGQNYLVSIPSAYLFADQSPRIRWGSYAVLNDVVDYLKQFRKVSVYVDAYTSPYLTAEREKALTLARATKVGNYLRDQGIDSRFVFTQGHGSDKPIRRSKNGGDGSLNSRIEITFRREVA